MHHTFTRMRCGRGTLRDAERRVTQTKRFDHGRIEFADVRGD